MQLASIKMFGTSSMSKEWSLGGKKIEMAKMPEQNIDMTLQTPI